MTASRATKPPRPPSRSRFQEGSMNDRASAVPPVQFIGPEERAALEKPLAMATIRPVVSEEARPLSPPQQQQQQQQQQEQQQQQSAGGKRGSKQFLGQMWDGVREKLRMSKRDSAIEKKAPGDDKPTREEVFANYQQLVESGFFASHAIQSTRQPGPSQPATSYNCPTEPPQWPLPQRPITPARNPPSPIISPASADSRGTKRPAHSDEDIEDRYKHHKKIRKSASIARFRSSSRLAARNFSASRNANSNTAAASQQPREPNRLTKRIFGGTSKLTVPERGSSTRRNLSETYMRPRLVSGDAADDTGFRMLRPRKSAAEPLRVKPDANRGIPSVPDIPAKFTYGEDRENHGPWRGLRRTNVRAA